MPARKIYSDGRCTLVRQHYYSALLPAYITLFIFSSCFLLTPALHAQLKNTNSFPALIPLPVAVAPNSETFIINPVTRIIYKDSKLVACAGLLQLYIKAGAGIQTQITVRPAAKNYILLQTDSSAVPQPEGYRLMVNHGSIQLTANNTAGIIYGIQTLRQLWQQQKNKQLLAVGCIINDYPRFAYRGMALDVSRHLFPAAFIKKYIDLLSLYKFNTFHWHLTDDQGWRIEIKKYPALQTVAAWRKETLIGHKKEWPHLFDGKKYGGYYTQQEIKEIITYAAVRNITIIPEIEMPGHALAALSAYPNLGCTGGPYQAATFWGVFDDVYCAGNDSTFLFLQHVLDEIMQLFPSPYIHIGGDECPKTKWEACPKCQQRIKDMHLKDAHALQNYFITRIEKYVNSKGKNIIGWDEILEGGLAPNATVMSWRGEEGGIAAAQQKHAVIMTPESHLYFDYYQSLYPAEPLAAGGYTPLAKVYSYEPAGNNTSAAVKQYIKGIEAQTWSEYLLSNAQAEYMIFPRVLAVAETGWTPALLHNFTLFTQRLRQQKPLLKKLRVNAADNFDEIQYTASIKEKNLQVSLATNLPAAKIFYTTDGSIPTIKSKLYAGAVIINRSCTLKARLFTEDNKPADRMFQQSFTIHKATGATVTLTHAPIAKYNPGAMALVNGINGNARYNDGQWVGFSGDDAEVVIDLYDLVVVNSIRTHLLNYHWQRMWAPAVIDIAVSEDGLQYKKLYSQTVFPVNGINMVEAKFDPLKARYIKLTAVNKGIIPAGSYGAGGKALLLLDEIIVE
ncbi:MAG: family 20 glycosylhydrolase [Chitinophagaceae bacterium]